MAAKNAQNRSQQRARLWPDSSVVARQTFKQRQLRPSRIKKLVARLLVRQGPTSHFTTARQRQQTTDTIEIPGTEILGRIFVLDRICNRRFAVAPPFKYHDLTVARLEDLEKAVWKYSF